MDAARWQRLQELFHQALELPGPSAQREWLERQLPGDPDLAAEVLGMLAADDGSSLLDRPVEETADAMLGSLPPAGTRFGPYAVKSVIGEGGMGLVCLAERADLGSVAAIKILRDAWLSPARRERFVAEQRMLAQLIHPGIARLYDAGTLPDGTPWFAMEYVEGMPLTQYCRHHRCTIEERLRLLRQACEAVRFAHAHAVIHRDIKPSNMLVKKDGSVRLLDFGIAKQLDGLEAAGATRTVLRLMTPAYAAPEQVRGEQIGVHTDVYALGVMLYELLTGRLPYDTQGVAALENPAQVAARVPARPSQVAPHPDGPADTPGRAAWADLDVLCLKAMHPDPARRYSSVEALLRDIDNYLLAQPLDARPDGWNYRAGKWLRRHWQVAGVAAAGLVLVIGVSAVFTLRLTKARDAAQLESSRTARVQQLMTSLFQGGEPLAGPGTNLKVIDVLDRGVREAQGLTDDPDVQADLLHNLASIFQKLRQPERADELFAQALRLRTARFGANSTQVAESLIAAGMLRIDQARLEDAERLVRHGRALLEKALPAGHPQVVAAGIALGRVLRERGEYDESIATLTHLASLQADTGIALQDGTAVLAELADAHYSAGHYDESRKLYEDILAAHEKRHGDSHPLVASDVGNLAAIQQDLGYYAEAEKLASRGLAIIEGYYGPSSPNAADFLTTLGRARLYQEKYPEASAALERALHIQEAAFGADHPVVAETVNELGNVLASQGDYAAAAGQFARTARIYHSVYGDQHYLGAIARSNLAYMHMQQGDFAKAEPLFREVIDVFTRTLSADNVNTGIARIKLGRTLLRAGRPADAVVESLAGHEVLSRQTSPSISYLRAARNDLVAAHEALGQKDQAARFREELTAK